MTYGFSTAVTMPFEQAVQSVTDELSKEGFGVLTTIDVRETLKKKIDADIPRYVILGACNPHFANKAIAVEQEIGLLLPCNVIVYEKEGTTVVALFDPMVMETVIANPQLQPVAEQVRERLLRVFDSMKRK